MADEPAPPEKSSSTSKPQRRQKPAKSEKVNSDAGKPKRRGVSRGDNYDLSGDFRGAVINIKSTIVSSDVVKDLENLPPEPGEAPFQGLQYYDEKDADRFFGRENLVAKIVGRLANSRFLTVIGASGSGKSSVVRAGVIPALRRGERLIDGSLPPTDSGQWDIRIFTPGAHPLDALAASLTRESESVSAATTLRADLTQEPRTLALTARRLLAQSGKKRLMLVIDQFEEIFTQCRQDDERTAFLENLLHAIDPADPQPITVLLTLRADFYAQLAAVQERLRELVSQSQEFIGAMSREELTRAILQPAALGNWKVQEGLVEVILNDLGSEPGALPLLSHALLETWKRRRGRVLTVSGYTDSGGVHGAIAQTAESVFRQRLTEEQQPIARMIFIKLAEIGEGTLDTRRRAAFSELITRATDTVIIDAVLGILTDARLITTDTLEPGDTRVVEVAHEALIREWPTLRDWLNQNRAGLLLHRQLTEDTNDWIKLDRDPGALYRGVRLQQMVEWSKANTDLVSLTEQEFLDASQKLALEENLQRQRLVRARRVQVALGGAAGVLVVVVAVVILAVNDAFAPREMSGIFNVAVAEFGEMESDGVIRSSAAGERLTEWTVNYLRDELKEDPNLSVWPDESNFFRRTRVGLIQPAMAEQTASDINADLLLYGYIDTRSSPAQLVLNFWVTPQDQYKFEDIQGNIQIGKPIRILDLQDPGIGVQRELERQTTAMAFIAMGLAQEQLGQSEDALAAFLKAGEMAPQSEMVKFFIGREYLFISDLQPDRREELWQKAEDALQQALAVNDMYARAYIALGALYRKKAEQLVLPAIEAQQAPDSQAMQWIQQAIASYQKVLELKPDPEQYGNPVEDVARLALGNAYRLQGVIFLLQGDIDSALQVFDEAIKLLETSRPVFEASVTEHESYRRYLAQTYEYLGIAYQWQGNAFDTAQDYEAALIAYQKSIDAFNQCILQGETSPDLVIQNDIVANVCQPTLEEVQQTYNDLSGGQ